MEKKIRLWGLLYLFIGMRTIAFGQVHSLTDEVERGRNDEKLPGANIKIKDTSLGTVADNSGGSYIQLSKMDSGYWIVTDQHES